MLEQFHNARLKHPPLTLDADKRRVVRAAIVADCEHQKRELLRVNVRTNHVHAVLRTTDSPDMILKNMKAWATRKLREAGLVDPDRPVWTEGGSKRWLWSGEDVSNACDYVANQQGADLD